MLTFGQMRTSQNLKLDHNKFTWLYFVQKSVFLKKKDIYSEMNASPCIYFMFTFIQLFWKFIHNHSQ